MTLLGRRFLSILLLFLFPPLYSTEDVTVASKFKAPNAQTAPKVAQEYASSDLTLWQFVESHVPAVLQHTGAAAFDDHLKGVQAVLRFWDSPEYLTNAGLLHSIYGTEGFQGYALPLEERKKIKEIIGNQAEQLCWIFCMVDRYTVDKTVFSWNKTANGGTTTYSFRARPELGRFEMILSKQEWLDFIELTLADWLEQVEGAALTPSKIFWWKTPGEAYAYRRLAYRKMSQVLAAERPERLGEVVPAMLSQVMATEPLETRHLHQERTPPMSEAAKQALNAMRSAGYNDIPIDFSPQPMNEVDVEVNIDGECESTMK